MLRPRSATLRGDAGEPTNCVIADGLIMTTIQEKVTTSKAAVLQGARITSLREALNLDRRDHG
jgi:hypothetical protein